METPGPPRTDLILDAALALAAARGWRRIHLHDVAEALGMPLAEIAAAFPDLDAVGNRLFIRARDAMLQRGADAEVRALPARQRLEQVLIAWFDALTPHRDAARDILMYKLSPGHLHHQAALVVALSRTVQWVREAAGLAASGLRRSREEAALTLLLLSLLPVWFTDRSPSQARTKDMLRRRLAGVGGAAAIRSTRDAIRKKADWHS